MDATLVILARVFRSSGLCWGPVCDLDTEKSAGPVVGWMQ